MEGDTWRRYERFGSGIAGFLGKYFVAFGHKARPGENSTGCGYDQEAPEYMVDSVRKVTNASTL